MEPTVVETIPTIVEIHGEPSKEIAEQQDETLGVSSTAKNGLDLECTDHNQKLYLPTTVEVQSVDMTGTLKFQTQPALNEDFESKDEYLENRLQMLRNRRNQLEEKMRKEIAEVEKEMAQLSSDSQTSGFKDPPVSFYKESEITKQTDELKKASGDKYPGLVIAVVGEETSYVPKPWNITRFTSELLSTVKGVNNYWIIYKNNQHLTYHLENAFKIERNKTDGYFVIMPDVKQEKTTKKVSCSKRLNIKDDELPSTFKYLGGQKTVLVESKSNENGPQMDVPVVMIAAVGDLDAAKQIERTINFKIPVLLIKRSGKIADLISNNLLRSEINRNLNKKNAAMLGLFSGENEINNLLQLLETIKKSEHLISVYDLNKDEVRMEDFIVDCIIAAWSLEGKKENKPVQQEDIPTQILEKYKTELKPGSSSLYFYIAYQYIQENQSDKENKERDLQLLLAEAILANRVEFASAMLQDGINFAPEHLDYLYHKGLRCPSCKAKDCIQIHSVHHHENSSLTDKLWCTCKASCKLKIGSEHCSECTHDIVTCCFEGCKCLRHDRKTHDCTSEADTARKLLKKHLGCGPDVEWTKDNKICPKPKEEGKNENDDKERKTRVFHDLLIWSLFSNKPDFASVFWSRCPDQLLTALTASALLKNMAETAKGLQNRKLHDQLLQQSKLFHDRVFEMQNTLYEDDNEKTMKLMHEKSTVWGMETSPTKFAFENKMIDIIGHPCVQRQMNRIWYNKSGMNQPEVTTASTNLRDFCKGFFSCCCCPWKASCGNIMNSFLAPLTVFNVHFVLMFVLLVDYSAFILTGLKTIQSFHDVSWYEWTLYAYLFADLLQEVIHAGKNIWRYWRKRKHTLWFLTKRFCTDFWEVFRVLSYIVMIAAVIVRFLTSGNLHRITLRLYSLGLFLIYIRFLQCMIINNYLGPKLIMIAEMLLELLKFIWILILFMLCAGVLYHANMYPNHYDMFPNFEFARIWKIMALPYWQIYGELSLEELKGENNSNGSCTFVEEEWEANPGELERCVEYDWVILLIAAFYFLFTNLLLVNLLIAIFSNEYEEINKNSDRLWKFSRYSIITKFEERSPVPLNFLWLFWRIIRCCWKKCKKSPKNTAPSSDIPSQKECPECKLLEPPNGEKCQNCKLIDEQKLWVSFHAEKCLYQEKAKKH